MGKEWIKIHEEVKVIIKGNFYTLKWPNDLIELKIPSAGIKNENNIFFVKIGTKAEIIKHDGVFSDNSESKLFPNCPSGKTRCTGGTSTGWGLAICCDNGFILSECIGNWQC